MRTPLISTQTSQLNKALCTSACSTPASHCHACLPHSSSVKHPQDADKPTSSFSTLFSSQMLFTTCHSKPKQATRAPCLIMLCPTGSWRLYSSQTMRYWLWLGKLGPARGVIQQLYPFQDNSGTPHYFWCTIDFTAIKSWRFQTWLKCQISIKKKTQTFTKWMLPGDALATLHPSPTFWSPPPINFKQESSSDSVKVLAKMAGNH